MSEYKKAWGYNPRKAEDRIAELEAQLEESGKVIRCKDCRHYGAMVGLKGAVTYFCGALEYTTREPDDFCSWAEEGENAWQRHQEKGVPYYTDIKQQIPGEWLHDILEKQRGKKDE